MNEESQSLPAAAASPQPCARESLITDHNPPITRVTLWAIGIQATDEQAESINRLVNLKVSQNSRIAERERCAKISESFDDFIYESRKVDGYSKGSYAMIDGRATVRKIAAEIREGK